MMIAMEQLIPAAKDGSKDAAISSTRLRKLPKVIAVVRGDEMAVFMVKRVRKSVKNVVITTQLMIIARTRVIMAIMAIAQKMFRNSGNKLTEIMFLAMEVNRQPVRMIIQSRNSDNAIIREDDERMCHTARSLMTIWRNSIAKVNRMEAHVDGIKEVVASTNEIDRMLKSQMMTPIVTNRA